MQQWLTNKEIEQTKEFHMQSMYRKQMLEVKQTTWEISDSSYVKVM